MAKMKDAKILGRELLVNSFKKVVSERLQCETNRWVCYYLALDAKKVQEPKQDNLIEKYFDMSILQIPLSDVMTTADAAKVLTGLESLYGLSLAVDYLKLRTI